MSALDNALAELKAEFGAGTVMRMRDRPPMTVETVSTGAATLDVALGIGGLPFGRVVEVYGPESSGKTTLVYHVLANAQGMGKAVAFIDAEHAMDPAYAMACGLDVDDMLVSQPDYGEQALEIADRLVRTGEVGVVAIDSVAALTPRAELDGAMGDQKVGLQARMMAQAMRKLVGNANRTGTLVVFTNQIREKVGVMFGSPETQPGGRALKFAASVRLDVRTTKRDPANGLNETRCKVVKNKLAPPYQQAVYNVVFGTGIDGIGSLIDAATEAGVLTKSGSWLSYEGDKLGQPKTAREKLAKDWDLQQTIRQAVYTRLSTT